LSWAFSSTSRGMNKRIQLFFRGYGRSHLTQARKEQEDHAHKPRGGPPDIHPCHTPFLHTRTASSHEVGTPGGNKAVTELRGPYWRRHTCKRAERRRGREGRSVSLFTKERGGAKTTGTSLSYPCIFDERGGQLVVLSRNLSTGANRQEGSGKTCSVQVSRASGIDVLSLADAAPDAGPLGSRELHAEYATRTPRGGLIDIRYRPHLDIAAPPWAGGSAEIPRTQHCGAENPAPGGT